MIKNIKSILPGFLMTFIIASAAAIAGSFFPVIGGPVFGILFGIIINHFAGTDEKFMTGINFSSKKILQLSIILLGGTLSLTQILQTGTSSFFVMIFTITAAFSAAFIAGRLLKVDTNLKSLIGVGTAICGGSAIAAVSPIIQAEEHEISYSISTIFLFNVIAVILFPPLGHMLGLSDYGFGLFAGTAVNDTSSVVAAGYTYSSQAGDFATIVKLTRTTMIIPVSILFMIKMMINRKGGGNTAYSIKKIFPWFILGFLAMAVMNTYGGIDHRFSSVIKVSARFMIVIALSAIGLKTDFRKMLKTGFRPLLLGFITWFSVSAASLAVQFFTKQL